MGKIKNLIDVDTKNDFELDMMYVEYLQLINEQPLFNENNNESQ